MRNKCKKILSLVAAATLLGSTVALTSCGDYYTQTALSGYVSSDNKASSNGGFAVEKDGYVYFINGSESYTADNTFGEAVKGSLMRISANDLSSGNYNKAETVVPMLFVAQDYTSGVYIYGDYVYYATPTTDKDRHGEIANSHLDFKCAKLDGSEAMKKNFFRLSKNATVYRYVQASDGVVYCLYEDPDATGTLKSYNTKTGDTTVLVEGAEKFYFDQKDLTNPNVYYTMGVTYDIDTDYSSTASYNQIYCVNAASTAKANAGEASYTVTVDGKAYRTYDFDKSYLESVNADEKAAAKEGHTDYKATYVFDDYTTYPYVNLGKLVLDGVGSECKETQYNDKAYGSTARTELQGYTYSISRYENGGVYYTRTEVTTNNNLYYLPDAADRDTVSANNDGSADVVTKDSTQAYLTTALYNVVANNDGSRTHSYLYLSNSAIYKAGTGMESDLKLCATSSSATLWKTEGNYLYYYASGSNPVTGENTSGYNLSRIDYTGTEEDYHPILNLNASVEYKPLTMTYVDFASSWYMPEMFGDVLLYANAQAIGSASYNYIYATSLKTADIEAKNDAYEKVYTHMEEDFGDDEELQAALTYYYRVGTQEVVDQVKSIYETDGLYTEDQYKRFEEFVTELNAGTYAKESNLIGLVGKVGESDQEAIDAAWAESLPHEHEEEEESGLETWQIVLIVAVAVIVVAAAVVIVVLVLKRKKAAKAEAEATVNAYKRKVIDTTEEDDIDVYADDEAEKSEE